jgi:hypothetical protein
MLYILLTGYHSFRPDASIFSIEIILKIVAADFSKLLANRQHSHYCDKLKAGRETNFISVSYLIYL